MIKEPPSTSIQDASQSANNDVIIKKWKEYLQNQNVISLIIEDLSVYPKNTAFVIQFPKSLIHLHDYKEKMKSATAEAIFSKEGHVQIVGIQDGIVSANFDQAWNEIYRRCTGKDLEFILTSNIPDNKIAGDLEIRLLQIREKLNVWINAFKKLSVVSNAEILENNEYGNLMEITIFTNASFLLGKDKCDAIEDYRLRGNGEVTFTEYSQGERDSLYDTWIKETQEKGSESETLEEFYAAVLDLNKRYLGAVPEPSKI